LDPERRDFINEVSSCYDYFFIVENEEVLKDTRIKASHINTVPLGCDPETHKSIDLSEEEKRGYGSDVAFVGTIKSGREKILAQLTDFDLGVWGYWEEEIPELRRCYRKQYIYGDDVCKIYNASKIVVDIPISYGSRDVVFMLSLRLFEISACGAFVLSVKTPYISNLYEIGKEMIYYKDANELKKLVKYYLDHPEERKLMAKRAQERTYRDYTYEKRIKEIFSIIEKKG
jgi:spore maturation protein CgeB